MDDFNFRFRNLNIYLENLNRISFVILLTLVLFSLAFCFNYILGFIKEKDIVLVVLPDKGKNIWIQIISTILFAPVFETFVGQSLPYYLLKKSKYFNDRNCLILITSALFFGLIHFYSLFYILYAFLLGLILMYGYMRKIKNDKKAFFLIAISHSLLNLSIFIINLF